MCTMNSNYRIAYKVICPTNTVSGMSLKIPCIKTINNNNNKIIYY
jgi:hypothetical protein